MGTCVSRCYNEVQRWSCWQGKATIEDRDRLMDFDMFLDDQPAPRPLSLSSLEKKDFNSSDVSLLHDSESGESDVLFQLGIENEEVEMQEEAAALEAYNEAIKIKGMAENSTELINPAKLALDNATLFKIEKFCADDKEFQTEHEGVLTNGKQKKDQASCSSPSSSVDLEWENEQGLSPVSHMPGKDEVSSDTASCGSQVSTPISNGNEELEWDGHFTSTHISQLDMETERLISEIELLTNGALQDQATNR